MKTIIFACLAFIFSSLISEAQMAPPWLKQAAKLIAQRSKATGYGHILRPMTEEEIMIRLLQDPWYREQLNWIKAAYPTTAKNFSRGLQGISKQPGKLDQLIQQIERSAIWAATQNPIRSPNPVPWLPSVYKLATGGTEEMGSYKLIIDGVEITKAELYGSSDDLKLLISSQLPVQFISQGPSKTRDSLVGAIEYLPPGLNPYSMQSGKIVAKLADPLDFKKVYRQAGKGRLKYCRILGELCLSPKNISFSLGCGENIQLQVTTEGTFSLSISGRSRTAELSIGN